MFVFCWWIFVVVFPHKLLARLFLPPFFIDLLKGLLFIIMQHVIQEWLRIMSNNESKLTDQEYCIMSGKQYKLHEYTTSTCYTRISSLRTQRISDTPNPRTIGDIGIQNYTSLNRTLVHSRYRSYTLVSPHIFLTI